MTAPFTKQKDQNPNKFPPKDHDRELLVIF